VRRARDDEAKTGEIGFTICVLFVRPSNYCRSQTNNPKLRRGIARGLSQILRRVWARE